jgi:seryl-tRNA synthetase
MADLVNFFDRALSEYARGFGAKGYQFPTLIGADVMDRCRYLSSFPQSLSLVSHLREDLSAIQDFAKNAHWDGEKLTVNRDQLANVETLLSSAVCYHYYAALRDTKMAASTMTAASGKCFRYESGNLGGLERLWDFTMRELILVGPREFVLSQRERAIGEVSTMLDGWGLKYEIRSATDPFFIDDFATQATFQLAFDLKFEVRAALPYKNSTLAAGSFNHHQDFFGRSFNITATDGQPAHTGCIAFGLERLALAFVAQHGFDTSTWPRAVASAVTAW